MANFTPKWGKGSKPLQGGLVHGPRRPQKYGPLATVDVSSTIFVTTRFFDKFYVGIPYPLSGKLLDEWERGEGGKPPQLDSLKFLGKSLKVNRRQRGVPAVIHRHGREEEMSIGESFASVATEKQSRLVRLFFRRINKKSLVFIRGGLGFQSEKKGRRYMLNGFEAFMKQEYLYLNSSPSGEERAKQKGFSAHARGTGETQESIASFEADDVEKKGRATSTRRTTSWSPFAKFGEGRSVQSLKF